MKLTDRAVRSARGADLPYKMHDFGGLYLYVTTAGTRLWRYDFRMVGRRYTYSMGAYPTISLSRAREHHLLARKLVSEGVNPTVRKKEEAEAAKGYAANTFRRVTDEYLVHLERSKKLDPDTVASYRDIFERRVFQKLGRMPIGDVKPTDILAVLTVAVDEGYLEAAKRVRILISSVFRFAAMTDRVRSDPAALLRGATKSPTPKHFPAVTDEARLKVMIKAINACSGAPQVRALLRYQLLTLTRPSESRFAPWDEIDLEESLWSIAPERMKMRRPHAVHLTAASRRILSDMRKLRRNDLVFPAANTTLDGVPVSDKTLRNALKRIGFGSGIQTLHGFRSTASSILNGTGKFRHEAIEAQLSHVVGTQTSRAYNHAQYWDERVELMEFWSTYVDGLGLSE